MRETRATSANAELALLKGLMVYDNIFWAGDLMTAFNEEGEAEIRVAHS